jgi:hypothetical protein
VISNAVPAIPSQPAQPHGIVSDGDDIVFTDRVKRQICRLTSDGQLSAFCGTGDYGRRDGAGTESQFCEPVGICKDSGSFYVTDRLGHSLRLISPTRGLCAVLTSLNKMLKVFGVHLDGVPAEQHSLRDAAVFLEQFHAQILAWTAASNAARGAPPTAHADGPQGAIPSRTVGSLLMVARAVRNVLDVINAVNPDYAHVVKLSSFLTLCVENFFSTMRARNPMPTLLEYAYLRIPAIKETAKLMAPLPFRTGSSDGKHYSLADGFLPFDKIKWPLKTKQVVASKEKIDMMREFTEYGRGIRQRAPRAQRSVDKTGALPPFVWQSAPPVGPRTNLGGVGVASEFSAHSWFAVRQSALPLESLPAGVTDFLLGRCNDGSPDDDHVKTVLLDLFASMFSSPFSFTFFASRKVARDSVFSSLPSADIEPGGCQVGSHCELLVSTRDTVLDSLNSAIDDEAAQLEALENKERQQASKKNKSSSKARAKKKSAKRSAPASARSRKSTRAASASASTKISVGVAAAAADDMDSQGDEDEHGKDEKGAIRPKRGDTVAVQLESDEAEKLQRPFAIGVCRADMRGRLVDVEVYVPAAKGALFGRWVALLETADGVPVMMLSVHQEALTLLHVLALDGTVLPAAAVGLRESYKL